MKSETEQTDTDIDRLLALAGPRDAVPADRLERMRVAVHDAWTTQTTDTTEQRPRRQWLFWTLVTAAAAAAIAMAVMRTPAVPTRVDAPALARAVEITTGPSERKSLPLASGGELRVDASSVVTLTERGEIRITKGAIYLDSKGKALPAVITPAGTITDVGTRFEVRLIAGRGDAATNLATRVRVRSGKVRLAQANAVNDVGANEELVARADGTVRRHVDPFGAEWAWVTRAAPRFELEGKTLRSFLDWIEKEGAWTIVFATPALERSARATELHGSIERMSTTEALDTILLACGLAHRIDLKTGRVLLSAE